MSFVSGLLLIDAPASALNNLGNMDSERYDNVVGVKAIRTREGYYPYVSAQAFRYWLRATLDRHNIGEAGSGWRAAPIYREEKIAYTDANPILYWDDDLFGYMRAPSGKASAKEKRESDTSRATETPTTETVTRISPFRVSTLVSISWFSSLTEDFGVMARHEGNPVPHVHQLYRTTLKGLFSLDLHAAGTFSYKNRTGYRNLDAPRLDMAKANGLEHLEAEKSYRLPVGERIRRVSALFDGLAQLEGGAKQTMHYTDVAPVVTILAVTRGGNNIFGHVVGANGRGLPEVKLAALQETLSVYADDLLSEVYIGWVQGFQDDERKKLESFVESEKLTNIRISHPRQAFKMFAEALRAEGNMHWLE